MARILVVDDRSLNRELVAACLDGEGHALIEVESGEAALALLDAEPFDLVLLDVVMPGIDGFETARRIRARPEGPRIPIVLVTDLADRDSRLRGLEAGVDDFLTKPLDRTELRLRVRNLLALERERTALARANAELRELHRFKDEMSAMVAHDLRNPTTVVLGNIDYLTTSLPDDVDPDLRGALVDARAACGRLLGLITNFLGIFKLETPDVALARERFSVAALVGDVLGARAALLVDRDITVDVPVTLAVEADRNLIERLLENLLDNALRYTRAGGRIAVRATRDPGGGVRIAVANSGAEIPSRLHARIFEKFGQSEGGAHTHNVGLGLYFCRLVAEAHGGHIRVERSADFPTQFVLRLPG